MNKIVLQNLIIYYYTSRILLRKTYVIDTSIKNLFKIILNNIFFCKDFQMIENIPILSDSNDNGIGAMNINSNIWISTKYLNNIANGRVDSDRLSLSSTDVYLTDNTRKPEKKINYEARRYSVRIHTKNG